MGKVAIKKGWHKAEKIAEMGKVAVKTPIKIFSTFNPSFQGNLVKIKGSPATVTAMPKPENLTGAELHKAFCNNVPR